MCNCLADSGTRQNNDNNIYMQFLHLTTMRRTRYFAQLTRGHMKTIMFLFVLLLSGCAAYQYNPDLTPEENAYYELEHRRLGQQRWQNFGHAMRQWSYNQQQLEIQRTQLTTTTTTTRCRGSHINDSIICTTQ